MTLQDKVTCLKVRINKLEGREKNLKCPGVLRKLNRQLKKCEMRIELEN